MQNLTAQAPGRICLFGEHQDYLGYPVVASAINKYIWVKGEVLPHEKNIIFKIRTPNIENSTPQLISANELRSKLDYSSKRDYLKSSINVAKSHGIKWEKSWDITISGNIPINAGASSSSALIIAWLLFLLKARNKTITAAELGKMGYQAEVEEFHESGGMMDHFSSAYGNVIKVSSKPRFRAKQILNSLDGLVLAHSGVKKSTVEDLKKVKERAISAFDNLKESYPSFDKNSTKIEKIEPYFSTLSKEERLIAEGNIKNRDITLQGINILCEMENANKINKIKLGSLISEHHRLLANNIKISIPQIDKMVEIALEAGAYGAKINGSGFGGTMFAYAPNNQDKVKNALVDAGYKAWKVKTSDGAKIIRRN